MSPVANTIFENVRKAMQDAEEIWGPVDLDEYTALMTAIKDEANQRIINAKENLGGTHPY